MIHSHFNGKADKLWDPQGTFSRPCWTVAPRHKNSGESLLDVISSLAELAWTQRSGKSPTINGSFSIAIESYWILMINFQRVHLKLQMIGWFVAVLENRSLISRWDSPSESHLSHLITSLYYILLSSSPQRIHRWWAAQSPSHPVTQSPSRISICRGQGSPGSFAAQEDSGLLMQAPRSGVVWDPARNHPILVTLETWWSGCVDIYIYIYIMYVYTLE